MDEDQSISTLNTLCGEAVVQSLLKRGIDTFIVSPGYRDAPLIGSLVRSDKARIYSAFDERSAAYQALGFAKSSGYPAVLICTSGTAVANYLPAVIEAHQTQVPMLIISADRPARLRHTNANQVIDQRDILGRFVKQSICFSEMGPSFSENVVASFIQKAIDWTASWPYGVVHINIPFDEPLEPISDDEVEACLSKSRLPSYFNAGIFEPYRLKMPHLDAFDLERFESLCKNAKRPFLIVGALSDTEDHSAVLNVLKNTDLPCYIDIASSLKTLHAGLEDLRDQQSRHWWDAYNPDLVIYLGGGMVTRSFERTLSESKAPDRKIVRVSLEDLLVDATHQGVWHLQVAPRLVCASLTKMGSNVWSMQRPSFVPAQANSAWQTPWQGVASTIWRSLPHNFDLLLGNSTTIRLFDEALNGLSDGPSRRVFCNRGASGIEGLVSTGIGAFAGKGAPVCVVLGDISLMHDLNSLLSVKAMQALVLIIVLNDGKGGIFEHLAIGKHRQVCEPYITTPHSFSFSGVAQMADLPYTQVSDVVQLEGLLESIDAQSLPALVELRKQ